jgi:hypothetical protein
MWSSLLVVYALRNTGSSSSNTHSQRCPLSFLHTVPIARDLLPHSKPVFDRCVAHREELRYEIYPARRPLETIDVQRGKLLEDLKRARYRLPCLKKQSSPGSDEKIQASSFLKKSYRLVACKATYSGRTTPLSMLGSKAGARRDYDRRFRRPRPSPHKFGCILCLRGEVLILCPLVLATNQGYVQP